MRDTDVNLYRESRLREEFGPFVGEPGPDGTAVSTHDIVGDTYRRVLAETTAIIAHQWRNEIARSVLKGFLFYGGVGSVRFPRFVIPNMTLCFAPGAGCVAVVLIFSLLLLVRESPSDLGASRL